MGTRLHYRLFLTTLRRGLVEEPFLSVSSVTKGLVVCNSQTASPSVGLNSLLQIITYILRDTSFVQRRRFYIGLAIPDFSGIVAVTKSQPC